MTNRWHRQRDQRKGSVTAIVVSYVILLHVLFGAYAQAALLGDGAHSPLFVLCDPHGVAANQDGRSETSGSSELNNLLCKSACALGAGLTSVPQGIITLAGMEALPPYNGVFHVHASYSTVFLAAIGQHHSACPSRRFS